MGVVVVKKGREGWPDQPPRRSKVRGDVPWDGGPTPRSPHEEAPSNGAPSREKFVREGRLAGVEEEGGPHEEAPSNGAPSRESLFREGRPAGM